MQPRHSRKFPVNRLCLSVVISTRMTSVRIFSRHRRYVVALTTRAEHLSKTHGPVLAMLEVMSDMTTGASLLAEHTSGDPHSVDRFVRVDDGDMHVVENGRPDAPALLLLSNAAAPTAIWDPVVPLLASTHHVIRVDLLGDNISASSPGGYSVPAWARRLGAVLDRLGVRRVTVVGHSSGCMLATSLAEQRPDAVVALALIDMGPNLDAKLPESLLFRLLLAPLTGRLLWRLRTENSTAPHWWTAGAGPPQRW